MIKVKVKKIIIFVLITVVIGSCIYGFLYLYKNFFNLKNTYIELKTSITELENSKLTYYSNIEIDTYKQMIENLKYSNDKILDTIYWALGSIAIVIFALLGTNLFFNFRINKEEIENIKKSFNLELEGVKNKYDKLIKSEIDDFAEESNNRIKGDFKYLSDNLQNQINIMSDNFGSQISTNKDKLEDKTKQLIEQISKMKEELESEIKDVQTSIINTKENIDIELLGINAKIWELEGVNINALNDFIEKALLEIKLNQSLSGSLDHIIEMLEKIKEISTWDNKKVNELINKIPEGYRLLKEKIESIIKTIKIK